jgi:hypothetical protein
VNRFFCRSAFILFSILSFYLLDTGCVKKTVEVNPYPDLGFSDVKQDPQYLKIMQEGILTVTITNSGGVISPATTLVVTGMDGRLLMKKDIPQLAPKTSIRDHIQIPGANASYRLECKLDPENNVYEKNRVNNILTYNVLIQTEDVIKKRDREFEDVYYNTLKHNNADACNRKIELKSFKRLDRIMDSELASPGAMVPFQAVLFNKCDKEIFDLELTWIAGRVDSYGNEETVFGQIVINGFKSGEKKVLNRKFRAIPGKWKIWLKYYSPYASRDKEIELEPGFILIVREEADSSGE